MNSTIAAIETHYAGCRFRSRIEARWAVFFDTLGVGWEYESQGFDLPAGPYLPDFKLALGEGVWWEVKGQRPTQYEKALCFDLASETMLIAYIAWGGIPRDYADDARIMDPMGNRTRWFIRPGSIGFVPVLPGFDQSGVDHPKLFAAYAAARSARFEHGQRG